jgi:hypothetical protein
MNRRIAFLTCPTLTATSRAGLLNVERRLSARQLEVRKVASGPYPVSRSRPSYGGCEASAVDGRSWISSVGQHRTFMPAFQFAKN